MVLREQREYPQSWYYKVIALSSAEPYEFLVKLRNITWETNYVIVSSPPVAHH
jgi:hypothetical protein